MKKLTTIVVAFTLLFSASAFTTKDIKVTNEVKTEFQKTFSLVTNVQWKKEQGFYVATFMAKDGQMAAAYSADGTLISISRYVTLSQLPMSVSLALKDKYAGYNIISVIELLNEGTSYFITAENEKYKYKIEANTAGFLTVVSKTKKK